MCNLYSQTKPQTAMTDLFKAKDHLGNLPSLPATSFAEYHPTEKEEKGPEVGDLFGGEPRS